MFTSLVFVDFRVKQENKEKTDNLVQWWVSHFGKKRRPNFYEQQQRNLFARVFFSLHWS